MAGIPRICPCGHRVPYGEACACQKAKRAEADKKRPSARKRGYDVEWQKAAASFLRQPGNERCACGAPATVVMHRISIRHRPDLRMVKSNWMPGCVRCNALQAVADAKAGGGSELSASSTGTGLGPFSRGGSQMEHFNRGRK